MSENNKGVNKVNELPKSPSGPGRRPPHPPIPPGPARAASSPRLRRSRAAAQLPHPSSRAAPHVGSAAEPRLRG
jgi:hypothetical protein